MTEMKKRWACAVFLTGISAIVFSQPTIAFLDSVLDQDVNQAVRGPVTERIIEHLVSSGTYTVLDRSYVQQVLSERQFQLSGMVLDSEIKEAGVYLGATYVGVARVSIIGNTFFISGKIINVETGVITAQTSSDRQGSIDVVLSLASEVGRALAGGEIESLPVIHQAPRETPAERRPAAAEREKEIRREGFSFGAGAMFEHVSWGFEDNSWDEAGTFSWNQLGIGAFADITYVQVGASYAMAVGDMKMKYEDLYWGDSYTEKASVKVNLVRLSALGKYPFQVGTLVFFPALGVEKNFCLSGEIWGMAFTSEDKKMLSDLFVLGGVGVDVDLASDRYVRVLALFGYNLTAEPYFSDPDQEWSGFKVNLSVAIGFR